MQFFIIITLLILALVNTASGAEVLKETLDDSALLKATLYEGALKSYEGSDSVKFDLIKGLLQDSKEPVASLTALRLASYPVAVGKPYGVMYAN